MVARRQSLILRLSGAATVAVTAVALTLAGVPHRHVAAAEPVTLYVSATSGSDAADCVSEPCRTIGAAVDRAGSDDTIVVAAGAYPEDVQVTHSLTIRGAGHDATTVDGSMTVGDGSGSGDGLHVTVSGLAVTGDLTSWARPGPRV